jgi:hypothetical protein
VGAGAKPLDSTLQLRFYNATNNLGSALKNKKKYFSPIKHVLAYYNAGFVVVNSKVALKDWLVSGLPM